jgi:hypothetical protein
MSYLCSLILKKLRNILNIIGGLTCALLLIYSPLWSQKSIKIDSLELSNGLKGHAMYEYVTKSGNEVLTGSFEFYQSQLDTLDDEYALGLSYEGEYLNDLKNGAWTYSESRLKPSVLKRLDRTNIIYAGSGQRFGVYAYFEKDIASGNWVAMEQEVDFGRIIDTLFLAKSFFSQGKMTGPFEAMKDSLKMKGLIDENGFLNGNWITYHWDESDQKVEENRVYENGVLVQHFLKNKSGEVKIRHLGIDQQVDNGENWQTLTIDADYLDALHQTSRSIDNKSTQESLNYIRVTNKFLLHSIFSFGLQNSAELWELNNEENIEFPKIKARVFPFSNDESTAIETANIKIAASLKKINDFLKDPIVDITRYNYKEVSMYFEIYKIYKSALLKLQQTFDRVSMPSFKYIDREKLLPSMIKGGIEYPKKVKYEYQENKQEEPYNFPEALLEKNVSIINMTAHVEAIFNQLKVTEEKLNPIIEKNKKRAEIAEKEEILVHLRDSIENLFENKRKDENYCDYHSRFKEPIITFSKREFKNYAQKNIELRIEEIDRLINCFQSFTSFYDVLIEINEKVLRIDEEYKRVVWNPFTYTDMEETVKERVYSAFQNKLLPHVLEGLERNMNCNIAIQTTSDFDQLYNRMLELREQDTRELERELRKTSSIDKIISLFKLKFKE